MQSDNIIYNNKIFTKYISQEDINNKIKLLSKDINHLKNKDNVFIGVLDGSVRFMMDLVSCLDSPYEIGFVKVKSYESMERGSIELILDIDKKFIENKNIFIIEDIIDSGSTIHFLKNHFSNMNPSSIKIVSLLVKEFSISKCDYYGFVIKNKFVVGYGMDINNLFRDLNDIFILDKNEKK